MLPVWRSAADWLTPPGLLIKTGFFKKIRQYFSRFGNIFPNRESGEVRQNYSIWNFYHVRKKFTESVNNFRLRVRRGVRPAPPANIRQFTESVLRQMFDGDYV